MNLRTLDLNLLRVLDALLREGSTVGASRRLGLSQPATSAALGRLRAALGDPLFVRQGQKLVATERARELEAPLHDILDQLGQLLAAPRRYDPASAEDTFRISGSDFFSELLIPPLAERLQREAPGVRLHLVDLFPQDYAATLERYEADLLLIPGRSFPAWCDWQPMFFSNFMMIARQDHPQLAGLAPGSPVPLDLFCDLGHVLFSPEGKLTSLTDSGLAAVGRTRRVVMTLPSFHGVCRSVSASDRVAMVPGQLADVVAPRLGLSIFRAPVPVPVPLMSMVWHRRKTNNPAHGWLRGVIASLMTPLNDGLPALPQVGS